MKTTTFHIYVRDQRYSTPKGESVNDVSTINLPEETTFDEVRDIWIRGKHRRESLVCIRNHFKGTGKHYHPHFK